VRHAVVVEAVEDEDLERDPDLVGGEPDPVRRAHGRDHVGDQRGQPAVEVGDRLAGSVHHRVAPAGHRADGTAVR
jgi:hypothetical protein